MKRRLAAISVIATVITIGCETDPAGPIVSGPTVQLSAEQAATINTRLAQLAPIHPELSWLADSIGLVIRTGAQVDSVELTTNVGGGPFYGIGLQRAITTTTSRSATFDAILFNNPSNPTDFVIVGGWRSTSAAAVPASVSGSFEAPGATSTVTAHMFQVTGTTVAAWRATRGRADFETGSLAPACPSFTPTARVTCTTTNLRVNFIIEGSARTGNGPVGQRWASLNLTELPGIQLRFQVP